MRCRATGLVLAATILIGCADETIVVDLDSVEIAFVRSYEDDTQQLRGFSPGQADVALAPVEPPGTSLEGLCWSPDGELLAFVRARELEEIWEIHLLDTQLGETRLITDGRYPDWSPIGRSLGFLRGEIGATALFVIDIESGDPRRIGIGQVDSFSWAPDGERLVVSGEWPELDENRSLYIVDAATGEPTRIDPDPPNTNFNSFDDLWPRWSADGSSIAFTSLGRAQEDVFSRVYRMNPDGTNLEQLPVHDDRYVHGVIGLSWSPVGEMLAYSYWYFDATSPSERGIALVGTNIDMRGATSVAWSPDATALAVVGSKGEDSTRIGVLSLDGDSVSGLDATGPWSDFSPAWRPAWR